MGTPPGDLVVEEEEAVEAGPSNSALPEDVEEEVEEVGNMCTPPGDRDVVDEGHFTSESAQILIGEIMGCNRDLENIKQNINDVQNKMKNIIDVLGRV
ncbi:hypothetical protein AB205_0160390 [Aquarana catesbeiana]|uniref:Uncharacterized protein n=1 Tax=Aquarana catesbeiana TaxID=8400 RepID=A0A2G9RSK9_AQUCT|nr:hypothetical protein AB205_0160390 [Aquarana catesbeiana]